MVADSDSVVVIDDRSIFEQLSDCGGWKRTGVNLEWIESSRVLKGDFDLKSAKYVVFSVDDEQNESEIYLQKTDLLRRLELEEDTGLRFGFTEDLGSINHELSLHTHSLFSRDLPAEQFVSHIELVKSLQTDFGSFGLERLLAKSVRVPIMSSIRDEVSGILELGVSVDSLATVVSRDTGLLSKVLMLANIGRAHQGEPILNVYKALNLLDHDTIGFLVSEDGPLYEPISPWRKELVGSIVEHSLAVARLALILAVDEARPPEEQHLIHSAAMLHEIGRIVLCEIENERFHDIMEPVRQNKALLYEEELRVFHTTYTEVGADLLQFWRFPPELSRLVRHHREPDRIGASPSDPLWVLHTANALVDESLSRPNFDPIRKVIPPLMH